MVAPLNIDIIFVVMLGAAIWTSIQLSSGTHFSSQRITLRRLIEAITVEGALCALVWAAINAVTSRSASVELVTQSLLIGCVWVLFSFVARLSFRSPAGATK